MDSLTPKQLEALKLATNMPAKVAADKMGITLSTYEKHLSAAREKLETRYTPNAVARAIKSGLIKFTEIALIASLSVNAVSGLDFERTRTQTRTPTARTRQV